MKKKSTKLTVNLEPGRKKRHYGYAYLTTGKLPVHRRYIEKYLTAVRNGLVRDLGPEEHHLTTAQIILIDRIVTKLGIIRCIEEHIRDNSVMIGDNLAPALGNNYISYNNSVERSLDKLGIHKKKTDETLDVQAYIKQFDEKKDKKAKAGTKK